MRIARLLAVAAIALAPFAALAQGAVAPLRLPAGSTGPADALTIGGSTLPSVLGAKAPLASPAFTGAVTAPSLSLIGSGLSGAIDTATVGGTAVSTILGSKAPLANPAFQGTVTAPALSVSGTAAVGSLTGDVSGATVMASAGAAVGTIAAQIYPLTMLTSGVAGLPVCDPASTTAPVPAGQPYACGSSVLIAQ
ncbi:hypothetical protein [Methylobacterium ajmalii]|uniref:hypothetical protein n=2 Tax=Methylobacteriaceae TaxID=119045 RepID=UPI0008EF537C|nr:hypothetical protein [Methylobacterium ajmalii]MBK3395342.1 hypothetical protein [Methylobacterium ajmalii]MBK3407923.1 hypothetical protein [Methylobacterium ajmalii]SFF89283.1 hypothetical protein SAMN04487844_1703 [Methylobacterium sp. yr596]